MLRQKRRSLNSVPITMRSAQQFTVHSCPVSAFSARASSGGVKRVSRQVPVQGFAGFGSRRSVEVANVSL